MIGLTNFWFCSFYVQSVLRIRIRMNPHILKPWIRICISMRIQKIELSKGTRLQKKKLLSGKHNGFVCFLGLKGPLGYQSCLFSSLNKKVLRRKVFTYL